MKRFLVGVAFGLLALMVGCASGPKTDFSRAGEAVCRTFSPELAFRLARLSAVAYQSKRQRKRSLAALGFRLDREIQDAEQGTQGFLAFDDRRAVVALAGTEDVKDVLKDAQIWVQEGREDPLCGKKVGIHNGFYRALRQVRKDPALFQRLEQLQAQGRSVYFTGHSLGGALAVILAYFTRLDHPEIQVAGVYTYGQPYTGTRSFQTCYDTRLKTVTFRYVNNDDAIPRLRPGSDYRHVGIPLYLAKDGTVAGKAAFRPLASLASFLDTRFVDDHDIARYLERLEKNRSVNPFGCSKGRFNDE